MAQFIAAAVIAIIASAVSVAAIMFSQGKPYRLSVCGGAYLALAVAVLTVFVWWGMPTIR